MSKGPVDNFRLQTSCLNDVRRFAAIVDKHDPTGPFFSISPQQAYSQFSVLQNVYTFNLTITLQGKNFKINGSKKY